MICVAFGLEVVVYIMRLYSATSDMFLFVLVLTTAFCSVAAYLLMAQRSMWPRKAPKHCTRKVDSMIAASKLHLTLDLGGHSGNSSTSSSSSRDASAECPSSGVSAREEPVGDMHAAVIFRPSGPGTRTVRFCRPVLVFFGSVAHGSLGDYGMRESNVPRLWVPCFSPCDTLGGIQRQAHAPLGERTRAQVSSTKKKS